MLQSKVDKVLRKNYSLQIAISSLFIIISAALGGILSLQSFNKTSDIMLDSAYERYDGIAEELILDFKQTYGSLAVELKLLALSSIISSQSFVERITYLPEFQVVLESDESVHKLGVAFKNGDYFSAQLVAEDELTKNKAIPENTAVSVSYTKNGNEEPEFEPAKTYHIYFDDQLKEISRTSGKVNNFDPRKRLWYQQAEKAPKPSAPYVFYESKEAGLTTSIKTSEPGVVIAIDITLNVMSEKALSHQVTPGSEVILINAAGQTFAYKDQSKVVLSSKQAVQNPELQLASLGQLGSGVLSHLGKRFRAKEIKAEKQGLDFDYNGRRWIGSIRLVAKPGDIDLFAIMISPVDELLADAIVIRWQLLLTALIVLLMFIPVIWFAARKISTPLHELSEEAQAISRFEFNQTERKPSFITEVIELDSAMELMKSTINKFIKLINSLAEEQDLDILIQSITRETMLISKSDVALIYLLDEKDDRFKANFLCEQGDNHEITGILPQLSQDDMNDLILSEAGNKSRLINIDKSTKNRLKPLLEKLNVQSLSCLLLPLENRKNEVIGLLCLAYKDGDRKIQASNIEFIEALSGFAAVTLESRQLINMQAALFDAFIKLIAGAIDAKSPYTGGHCNRVPEITFMLARAACDSRDEKFKGFDLDKKQWEELSIAGWLHDCGKVTTPEYVVDKATKLETIYDRIHEVRMRFEVLKRDAEIDCWQKIADGKDKKEQLAELDKNCQEIDDDFSFVALCNVGGEFMADENIERLQAIAEKTWKRTLDDNLGISWEELSRKQGVADNPGQRFLPVEENLLSDKAEHLIARHEIDKMPLDNQWGFKVDTPEYKYNRGELHNLTVKKGTLSEEDRYIINGHMIQTIIMLNKLPYPKHLRNVPLIAGSHHETMDGKGYPKKLVMTEQPLTARMMVIADIFEALTAADRPYKKAKSLTESLRILSFMRNDKHIDADLFDLFLTSGVYLEYAEKFLLPEQIDEVDIRDYISADV